MTPRTPVEIDEPSQSLQELVEIKGSLGTELKPVEICELSL
jgi:hypothetical protein